MPLDLSDRRADPEVRLIIAKIEPQIAECQAKLSGTFVANVDHFGSSPRR
jgi:hypothetical protein